eukprot:767057-Hanusia_phi.AAC.1
MTRWRRIEGGRREDGGEGGGRGREVTGGAGAGVGSVGGPGARGAPVPQPHEDLQRVLPGLQLRPAGSHLLPPRQALESRGGGDGHVASARKAQEQV